MEGGVVWNSINGSMIFHTTKYRNKISCSPKHNFNSVYTVITLLAIFGSVNY
jgi:hypothetical protein